MERIRTSDNKSQLNSKSKSKSKPNDMGSEKRDKNNRSGSSEERRQQKKASKHSAATSYAASGQSSSAQYGDDYGYDSQQSDAGSFPDGPPAMDTRKKAEESRERARHAHDHKGVKYQQPLSRQAVSANHIQNFDVLYQTGNGYQTDPRAAHTPNPEYPLELDMSSDDGNNRGHGAPAYHGHPSDSRYYPGDSRYY